MHGKVHIDRALSDISYKFSNGMPVAEFVFPPRYVTKESDDFFRITNENFRTEKTGPRGYFEPAMRAPYGITTDKFNVEVHSLFDTVPSRQEADADDPLDLSMIAVENLTDKLILGREVAAADLAFTGSNYGGNTKAIGSAARWEKAAGEPIKDINDAADAVRESVGMQPNAILFGAKAWSTFQNNEDVVDRFKHVREGTITESRVVSYFDWAQNAMVGRMVHNSAKEGAADDINDVWGKSCLVFYRDPAQVNNPRKSPRSISFGRNFRPRRERIVVTNMGWNPPALNHYVELKFGLKILENSCGYLLTTVVT